MWVADDPTTTAVVCMEMQRGVAGDLAGSMPARAAVEARGVVARLAQLLTEARRRGVLVVHCTAAFRPDRKGSYLNLPHVAEAMKDPGYLAVGSPHVEPIPELFDPSDFVSQRLHGISPFTDTSLDPALRSFGARTVVATGVSLNRGVIGLTIEAVNRGYRVVIPRDCVAGYPADYGDLVLEHTLAALAVVTDSESIVRSWRDAPS
ncbi:MAG TPA: cysteine hydrolase [Acidimicrobiales bacterium]